MLQVRKNFLGLSEDLEPITRLLFRRILLDCILLEFSGVSRVRHARNKDQLPWPVCAQMVLTPTGEDKVSEGQTDSLVGERVASLKGTLWLRSIKYRTWERPSGELWSPGREGGLKSIVVWRSQVAWPVGRTEKTVSDPGRGKWEERGIQG